MNEKFKDDKFKEQMRTYLIKFLENRPDERLVASYERLCEKYGLDKKKMFNKDKIKLRIKEIVKTDGKTQNYRNRT
ncbi:hypothetical protein B7C51_24935 (plasmid) [Paenibacillus larvae subsp. pulvifaciens]|uniref:Uncharacterized protein n=1 Tax=Paenibacillus larvae subsp. pulvifaciens TaxID=1477 RepID=A0A1V0UZR1_9BACL|nr:hypothetical protein [Paenibacillus larvae]ARF70722.1 hypothetical protein B7C51_24935 [Paenibacillus larvae subsp. pulvifaciens]